MNKPKRTPRRRALYAPITIAAFTILLAGCLQFNLAVTLLSPFDAPATVTGDPTPTAETAIATPTTSITEAPGYIGFITPNGRIPINIRPCKSTSNITCPPYSEQLLVGKILPVLSFDGTWYEVEWGQNATGHVLSSVVTYYRF